MKALPNYNTEILPTFNNLTVDSQGNVVACNVFYAGGNGGVWTFGLWPHSWSLYNVGAQSLSSTKKVFKYQVTNIGTSLKIGTFCHENGLYALRVPRPLRLRLRLHRRRRHVLPHGQRQLRRRRRQPCPGLRLPQARRPAGATTTDLDQLSSRPHRPPSPTPPAPTSTTSTAIRSRGYPPNISSSSADIKAAAMPQSPAPALPSGMSMSSGIGTTKASTRTRPTPTTSSPSCKPTTVGTSKAAANSGDAYDLYYLSNSTAVYNNRLNDATTPNAQLVGRHGRPAPASTTSAPRAKP